SGRSSEYEHSVVSIMRHMKLLSRYSGGGGVYNLHTDTPLAAEDLDSILQTRMKDGTLTEFLNRARV
ncbi:hypothetical protein V6O07_20910, partial [Arthrospira platensis SPKY2]